MPKIQFNNYLPILATGHACGSDVEFPAEFARLSESGTAVDMRLSTKFYISPTREKFVARHDPAWQQLDCSHDDELVDAGGGLYRVKSHADAVAEMQSTAVQRIKSARDSAIVIPVESAALGAVHTYAVNAENRAFLNALITLGNGGKFTCIDVNGVKSRCIHTHAQFMSLAADIEVHISAQFDHYDLKIASIVSVAEFPASTQADFDAIAW